MVDVSEKATTDRIAVAHGRVEIKEEVISLL
ncbi:MAG: cyclic pyranopterin monophosphate synthase MoaC, partial [Clostridia bacterium]|nr:cyclic pyranopterin monophosphate synthase MoaC [Clostridia bacterium]